MAIDREKAVDRVRKLFNHAKSTGERYSEAEIENYLNHARKIMDEFNISNQEIQSDDGAKAAYDSIKTENAYSRANRLDGFMVDLAWTPCNICDVKFYTSWFHDKKPGRYRQTIVFYGLPRDVAVASELYKELLACARVMCKVRYGEARPPEYKDYCAGFAFRLRTRSAVVKTRSTSAAETTAIVLRKDVLVDRWAKENLRLETKATRQTRNMGSDAYTYGYKDGEKVSLDTNQVTGNSQRSLP